MDGRDGPWPGPTQAYFWLVVNKRLPPLIRVLFDLTQRDFFDPKRKKLKNLTFLGDIFQIQTQTISGLPNPTRATKNWPDPSLKDGLTQTTFEPFWFFNSFACLWRDNLTYFGGFAPAEGPRLLLLQMELIINWFLIRMQLRLAVIVPIFCLTKWFIELGLGSFAQSKFAQKKCIDKRVRARRRNS